MDIKNIISSHGSTVRSIIRRITNEQNEDLEQEVYTKVWKNSDKYKEKGTFNAWIRTISANLAKDYLKSSQKKLSDNSTTDETVLSLIKDNTDSPEALLMKKERQKKIFVNQPENNISVEVYAERGQIEEYERKYGPMSICSDIKNFDWMSQKRPWEGQNV